LSYYAVMSVIKIFSCKWLDIKLI